MQKLMAGIVVSGLLVTSMGVTGSAPSVPEGISQYVLRDFDRTTLLDEANRGEIRLPLLGGEVVLDVWPSAIHAPDARVIELDENGAVRRYALAPIPTFHGTVKGEPGSFAAITFMEQGISGFVYDEEWIDFQPLRDFDPRASIRQHVVFRSADVVWDFSPEGSDEVDENEDPLDAGHDAPRVPLGVEIQVSNKNLYSYVDWQFYDHYCPNGGLCTEYNNQISNIMNRVNAIYGNQVGFNIVIDLTVACTSYACDSNEGLHVTNDDTLINNFRDSMYDNYCCTYGVAHLWSHKNLDGGVIGRAHEEPSRYALTQHRAEGNYDASDYQRGVLVAHEMGHNFDARHQYSQSWFDIWCWCTKYTIMYTPWQGGSMAEEFTSTNRDRITNTNNNWGDVGF